jgi:hypothetical protein
LKQYETKAETKKRKRERGGEKGRVDESKKKGETGGEEV